VVITGLICIRQKDVKSLVAYSSVVHIGIATIGIFRCLPTGIKGCIFINLAHGIRSPIIFYIVYLFYERLNRRRILLIKGVNNLHPIFYFSCFFVMIASLGVPPIMSFFSEFIVGISALIISQYFLLISGVIFFLSGSYIIYYFVLFRQGTATKLGYHPMNSLDLTLVFIIVIILLILLITVF
jgi:NADH:ubiquinone oxidoreductase subunit 4 (subunit M)